MIESIEAVNSSEQCVSVLSNDTYFKTDVETGSHLVTIRDKFKFPLHNAAM